MHDAKPRSELLLAPTPPTNAILASTSVEDIVSALATIRDARGWQFHGQDVDRHGRIVQLVRHLVAEREQPASPFVYECMMDAMADPQGSVKGIRKLLEDMTAHNMKPTAAVCASALAALANHPDYVLRREIVDTMREYWFAVDTPAQQSVVLGLLRDGQPELAYARLSEMLDRGARVDTWVHDVFIMVFGKLGFLDEMLQLLCRRGEDDGAANVIYYALDVCSASFHHQGTAFAWTSAVRSGQLQPPDGVVENVLATAARHGDATLATEALDLLSRRTRVLAHHYEAVAEAFAKAGDAAGMLRTLSIMQQAGIAVVRSHTRSMYASLVRQPALLRDAEDALRTTEAPAEAVGAILEAIAETRGTEAAMELYVDGGSVGPETMHVLIAHSRDEQATATLVRDYAKYTVHDDGDGLDMYTGRMIEASAKAGELDVAFRLATRAAQVGNGNVDWLRTLAAKATEVHDARIWSVVDALSRGDDETAATVRKILRQLKLRTALEAAAGSRQREP